jgi:hypothetical protein
VHLPATLAGHVSISGRNGQVPIYSGFRARRRPSGRERRRV